MENLTDDNFFLFAAKYYDNPGCYSMEEFQDDLNHFRYLKRLFNKYAEGGELKERLILNHITVIYNVFGPQAATRMLFLKLKGQWHYLKPFLVFLSYMPEVVKGVDGKDIRNSDVGLDPGIVNALRKI